MSWSTVFWISVAVCLWLPLLSLVVYAYAWLAMILWRDVQWRRQKRPEFETRLETFRGKGPVVCVKRARDENAVV